MNIGTKVIDKQTKLAGMVVGYNAEPESVAVVMCVDDGTGVRFIMADPVDFIVK